MEMHTDFLQVGKKTYPWSQLTWFVLDIDPRTQRLKNIVLMQGKITHIHSLKDSPEAIKEFLLELGERVPMIEWYEQSWVEKMTRGLQL